MTVNARVDQRDQMKYQPHIDGLRTVAVLPVVIFHLGSLLFPGGYVGVDIFFVISGFLITGILLEDMSLGRYSLLEFYKRRILRIVPALAVVLIATCIFSGLLFFDYQRVEVGESIIAAAVFSSNLYFWQNVSYFSDSVEANPLLHTWSLSVEEQFYILFPPLLFVIFKVARKALLPVVIGITFISFSASLYLSENDEAAAFYLFPPRAWELAAGAALALFAERYRINQTGPYRAFGLIGLVLVLLPMFLLDSSSNFPGWNACAPVVGAMLLIGWGNHGLLGAILTSRIFVEIGKISYSLYLWHWPLIVFWKSYSGDHISNLEFSSLLLASCAAAALSTYIIERPFRSPSLKFSPSWRVALCGGVTVIGLVGVGAFSLSDLSSFRKFPENVQRVLAVVDRTAGKGRVEHFRSGSCFITSVDVNFDVFDQVKCASLDPNKANVLLIGDSHEAHYWRALEEAMPEANVMQATASGCLVLIGAEGAKRCTDLRDWVFDEFLPYHHVDTVILGGRWTERGLEYVAPTLAALKELATQVVVVGPTVEYEGVFPKLLARSMLTGEGFDFTEHRTPGRDRMNDLMRGAASEAGVRYVDVLGTICGSEKCFLVAPDGAPMQFDYGHLTLSGARYIVDQNMTLFTEPANQIPSVWGTN